MNGSNVTKMLFDLWTWTHSWNMKLQILLYAHLFHRVSADESLDMGQTGDGYLFPKPAPTYLSTHLAGDSGTLQHPRVSPVWRHCPEVAWVMAMCPQCVQLLESDYWPLCLCHWPVLADVLMLVIKILKIDTHVLMLVFSLLLKNTADNCEIKTPTSQNSHFSKLPVSPFARSKLSLLITLIYILRFKYTY